MRIFSAILGASLILIVLWESFETIVFPRRVTRRARLTRLFYGYTWQPFARVVRFAASKKIQESFLSYYGPLSLLLLISVWAVVLIVGFALLHWANGSALHSLEGTSGFLTDLYLSGTNFFTLGLGDVTPGTPVGKALTVVEGGMGLGFLALIISYLPALNQSFSRREVNISLLDARAGSPPTAAEMLRRHNTEHKLEELRGLLHEWEFWSAELLESHLSYPVLAYFRSQHDNESWLAALTVILDTCALVMAGVEGACARQAELTFAMARHAIVDLSIIFKRAPRRPERNRLPAEVLAGLRTTLAAAGVRLRSGNEVDQKLAELRTLYEPYVYSLSVYFHITLPPWISESSLPDNWQTSAWERSSRVKGSSLRSRDEDKHFK